SEAATGKPFVHYWMHNGFVTVGADAEKMSKSLHNFVTVHDLLQKVDPQVLRFFMASVQYRKQINYSTDNLKQAQIILQRFKNTLNNLEYRLKDGSTSKKSEILVNRIQDTQHKFINAMDDDFNVQNALTAIYDLLPEINANINAENADKDALKKAAKLLTSWLAVFGIDVQRLITAENQNDDEQVQRLIKKREEARKNKDWAQSDALRDELKQMGVTVEDTPQGTRWLRE
ncbi:MAG: class I tRNA ligase family protein, partial [Lactobacillus sp.]|nr:class I tRNA ligase family protein [Lactobacillus sp.]